MYSAGILELQNWLISVLASAVNNTKKHKADNTEPNNKFASVYKTDSSLRRHKML